MRETVKIIKINPMGGTGRATLAAFIERGRRA
jgi:hypothetical protein